MKTPGLSASMVSGVPTRVAASDLHEENTAVFTAQIPSADSNIASGPPVGSCWWHPWWGYICNSWIPTYDRTSFSFGGGIGVRADVSRSFFLELSYNGLWVDFADSTPGFDGIRLNVGWLF